MQEYTIQGNMVINSSGEEIFRGTPFDYKFAESLATRKYQNIQMAKIFRQLGEDKLSERWTHCSWDLTYLNVNGRLKTSGYDEWGRLISNHRCNNRFCPVCALFLSRKIYRAIYNYVNSKPESRFCLASVTIPSVPLDKLLDAVKLLNRGYNRLTKKSNENKWRRFSSAFVGMFRHTEITYNPKTGLFHPHMHILLECAPDYFDNPKLYYDQKKYEFNKAWARACGLPFDPVIHSPFCSLQVIRQNDTDLRSAVAEVAKYLFKLDKNIFKRQNKDQLEIFCKAILALRGVTLSGGAGTMRGILHFVLKSIDDDIDESSLSASYKDTVNRVVFVWNRAYNCYIRYVIFDDSYIGDVFYPKLE